jgi:hypothetical protein
MQEVARLAGRKEFDYLVIESTGNRQNWMDSRSLQGSHSTGWDLASGFLCATSSRSASKARATTNAHFQARSDGQHAC